MTKPLMSDLVRSWDEASYRINNREVLTGCLVCRCESFRPINPDRKSNKNTDCRCGHSKSMHNQGEAI